MYRAWSSPRRHAFTLVELLIVLALIGILAGISLPVYNQVVAKSRQSAALSNMKQVGAAFLLYAGDHNSQLPASTTGSQWPSLLASYVQNCQIYNAPIPGYVGTPYQVTDPSLLVSDTANNTDYIANGYNDLGTVPNPRLSLLAQPTQTIMLGIVTPAKRGANFYLNVTLGTSTGVVDATAWPNGSVYVFCDGSARILQYRASNLPSSPPPGGTYADYLWLAGKNNTAQ